MKRLTVWSIHSVTYAAQRCTLHRPYWRKTLW